MQLTGVLPLLAALLLSGCAAPVTDVAHDGGGALAGLLAPVTGPEPAAPPPAPAPLGGAAAPGPEGLHPLVRIPTTGRVVFLSIDDGYVRGPQVLDRLLAAHVPVTIFPTALSVAQDPAFFAALLAAGASLGDHSVTHPDLRALPPARQRRELCAAAAVERQVLHRAPVVYRPPYGARNASVARAARACGMRYELLWNATVNDGVVRNERGVVGPANPLVPGDLVLMHFRSTFAEDFDAALEAARAAGLTWAPITSYLPAGASSPASLAAQDAALAGWPAVVQAVTSGGTARCTGCPDPATGEGHAQRPGGHR